MSESLRLIVGLGNPGKEYEKTRHNLGFLVLDHLAKEYKLRWTKNALYKGFVAEGNIEGEDVMLLKPLTFVNHSGLAVKEAVQRKKIALENILVVIDDLNLDFEVLRLRSEGSAGGHNGLTSVIEHLRTQNFPRLRVGIGHPGNKDDVVDFVLSSFDKGERTKLASVIEEAMLCCKAWIREGTAKAMDQFNKRKANE